MTRKEFQTIVVPHHKDMFRLAVALTGNSDEAADLVQDTMLKLWTCRDKCESAENLKAYCLGALRNRFFDVLRTRRFSEAIEECTDVPFDDQAGLIDRRSDCELVMQLIDTLPPNQGHVIKLSSVGGYSNDEIAELTGLSPANVRTLLSRGRRRIKELFTKLN